MTSTIRRVTIHRLAFPAIAVLALAALLRAAPVASSKPSTGHAKLPPRLLVHVRARIRVYYDPAHPHNSMFASRVVTLKPAVVNVGTVVFVISNSDNEVHRFEINGFTSKRIGAGGRASMTVRFKHPGTYPVAITSDTPIGFGGSLKVVK